MACNVKINAINHLKKKGYVDDNMMVVNAMFFFENNKLSDLARNKYGVTNSGKLFTTERVITDKVKAVPNEEMFNELQEKHDNFQQSGLSEEDINDLYDGDVPIDVYNQDPVIPIVPISSELVKKVKALAEQMGISITDLNTYSKQSGIDVTGVNGVADAMRKVIAIAEGKEDVALLEELVHIATQMVEQTNPELITQMISKIDKFKIYKYTFEQYKNNKNYQTADGKPNIRKIKKEAVDKLIAELIINDGTNEEMFPELLKEENRSIIANFWAKILQFIRGLYLKSDISLFEDTAAKIMAGQVEGNIADMSSAEIYFQISDAQKNIQQNILATKDNLRKVVSKEQPDPLLLDTEEANNFYEVKQPDGTWARVVKRVTDRVKSWYREKFGDKVFTEEEKKFNEFKRKAGIKGHKFFEQIHLRYFNEDGTRRDVAGERFERLSPIDEEIYQKLETYYVNLINSFSKDGKNPLVFSEVSIFDSKEKEAGTIDLLIVEESGKANIVDWKFMNLVKGAKDVTWYKQGAYNIQLERYKEILLNNYGIDKFGLNRAIPILMDVKREDPKVENSPIIITGISIGSVNTADIEDLRLLPVSAETESTGFENLDRLLENLNAVYRQISKKVAKEDEEREFKSERLNALKQAIRAAQTAMNIAPLVNLITLMKKQGDQIMNDYNTIYKNRPALSEDSENKELSDFADEMREYISLAEVFGEIDDLVADLVYTKEMEANVTTIEAKEDVAFRKELMDQISSQARSIRLSRTAIKDASKTFADKHIGQRNLVSGLLSAEAVVKGLSSTFRGISELPLNSLQILFKLVTNAKGRASRDSIGEVDELIEIRKRLVDRGGDTRSLVQKLYQKDSKNNLVNKLIYKFKKEFYDTLREMSSTGQGDMAWIRNNVDIPAYEAEAQEFLKKRIARLEKLYDDNPALLDKLIEEEKQKFDLNYPGFNGWNNYILKRHPKTDLYTEEYKEILKDKDLNDLYNFITRMNQKANETGYISNRVMATFLPFVRKGMAESLAWDFSLSAVSNWGDALSIRTDDVGYGKVNELTGELENGIPKYYTYDFTKREDKVNELTGELEGVNDYSDVSEDIFKNMILYINHVEKYKYLSEVEGQLNLVKTIETFKNHLNTNRLGEVIFVNGKPEELTRNEENTKIFNDFLRALLYEQKYPLSDSDTPLGIGKVASFIKKGVNSLTGREVFKIEENPSATSLVKSMDAANRAFQLKSLGFEFISGAVNAFGSNIQLAAQSGNYFKAREVGRNEIKLIGNSFANDEERQMFIQLIDVFLPMKEDPNYEKLKKAGLTTLTRGSFSDFLMVFMREPEQHMEKSIFLTLLENMMVENGKIVSIHKFVKDKYKDRYSSGSSYRETAPKIEQEIEELKRTRSINATKKLDNGKLVIPGLDLTDITEIQRLSNLTRRISRNATGGLADSDVNRMSMNIWTRSMMVFKNWIPKLVDTRFGEFRKVSDDFSVEIDEDGMTTGEKYDIGRIRLFSNFLSLNIAKMVTDISDVIAANDRGLKIVDDLYVKYAEAYRKSTGKELKMDRNDFIDMVRNNLRNQLKELLIGLSLFGAMLALGMVAPDDEDDKADKNFHRYAQRTVDRFISELSFFYNPVEFQKMISGSAFPAFGIFSDLKRFLSHFAMETTGLDISNRELSEEEVRKKAQPIKNLAKMLPITKSLITYGAILDADFAKEYDVTIQKESRR